MEILGKGLSLNHPEDLKVTERALGKRSVQKLAVKKKKSKTSFKSQHTEVLMGSASHYLNFYLQVWLLHLRWENNSFNAFKGFPSFSSLFNFFIRLFCSTCNLEIEEKASLGFLLHRLHSITSFSEVSSTPLPHSFPQDLSLFDFWNYFLRYLQWVSDISQPSAALTWG